MTTALPHTGLLAGDSWDYARVPPYEKHLRQRGMMPSGRTPGPSARARMGRSPPRACRASAASGRDWRSSRKERVFRFKILSAGRVTGGHRANRRHSEHPVSAPDPDAFPNATAGRRRVHQWTADKYAEVCG